MINRMGPKTEPWGTLLITWQEYDLIFFFFFIKQTEWDQRDMI